MNECDLEKMNLRWKKGVSIRIFSFLSSIRILLFAVIITILIQN